mmetsp:Transcript_58851/g.128863  ORF Transcript_58851/g.128863 Transcript_58851/m.128863 type:complete len:276 (+) Transcript_58851:885-1712(+)
MGNFTASSETSLHHLLLTGIRQVAQEDTRLHIQNPPLSLSSLEFTLVVHLSIHHPALVAGMRLRAVPLLRVFHNDGLVFITFNLLVVDAMLGVHNIVQPPLQDLKALVAAIQALQQSILKRAFIRSIFDDLSGSRSERLFHDLKVFLTLRTTVAVLHELLATQLKEVLQSRRAVICQSLNEILDISHHLRIHLFGGFCWCLWRVVLNTAAASAAAGRVRCTKPQWLARVRRPSPPLQSLRKRGSDQASQCPHCPRWRRVRRKRQRPWAVSVSADF